MIQKSETMQKFSKLLEIVEKYGGKYQQGISRDTIWFNGENHKERAEKAFNECKKLGINVYYLRHVDGWEDEHNKVESHSSFEYR
jgi:hypothetical protein